VGGCAYFAAEIPLHQAIRGKRESEGAISRRSQRIEIRAGEKKKKSNWDGG